MSQQKHAAKVTSKGQVTIPKPVRTELGLQEGDYLIGRKAAVAPTDDFDELARRIAERFEKKGITREDVEDAIRQVRAES